MGKGRIAPLEEVLVQDSYSQGLEPKRVTDVFLWSPT